MYGNVWLLYGKMYGNVWQLKEQGMKKKITVRISEDLANLIDTHSSQTGLSKTDILEKALRMFFENAGHKEKELELFQKENEQLKMAIQILSEKQKAVEKVEETFRELIQEKEKRIEELKERLQELQERRKKSFWQFWK